MLCYHLSMTFGLWRLAAPKVQWSWSSETPDQCMIFVTYIHNNSNMHCDASTVLAPIGNRLHVQ